MKYSFFLLASFCLLIFSFTIPGDTLKIGSTLPKPDHKMKDISEKMVSFNDAKLKNGLLVMFTCNTCPWVHKNESRTVEITKYALDNNVGVILLNPNEGLRQDGDSFEEMKKYAAKLGYDWYYVVDKDHQIADEFGANRTPECFLFNAENKLVYHGAIDDNPGNASAVTRKHLQLAIDEMNAGKEVTQKETRSLGCSIKRLGQ